MAKNLQPKKSNQVGLSNRSMQNRYSLTRIYILGCAPNIDLPWPFVLSNGDEEVKIILLQIRGGFERAVRQQRHFQYAKSVLGHIQYHSDSLGFMVDGVPLCDDDKVILLVCSQCFILILHLPS